MARTEGLSSRVGQDEDTRRQVDAANREAVAREVKAAREQSQGRGLLAMNVMRAVSDYAGYVKASLEAGADAARVEAVQAPIELAIGAKTAEEIALSILAQIVEVKNARPQTEGFAPALLAAMEQAAQNGQPAVLATIIARHGSTPREVGSKMLLLPDGTTVGSVGGGIMEYRTRQAAAEMLAGHTASVQTVTFSADGKNEDAAVAACGGSMELLLEIIPEGGSIE
jgi:xanthine dehydrogenase accessory factor